jgi:segregation and condensation protein A
MDPIPEPPAAPAIVSEPAPVPEPIVTLPIETAVQIAAQSAAPDDLVEPAPAVEPVPIPAIPASDPILEPPVEPVALAEPTPEVDSLPIIEPSAEPAPASETVPSPAPTSQPVPDQKPVPKAPIKLETRDDAADLSPFSVVVEQVYDGPLDLLLDLIRKQDIDIYDIPIARITAQFLAYVNRLKASDVDVAGEFIYIASLLIHIKSKMLLPRAPSGPEEAAEDPRRELVERLLEHERFKNAAQMLQQKQMLEAATWTNPGFREFQDEAAAEPEIAADTVDLVRIFRDILERARNRPVIDLEEDSVTVGQMIQFLARRLTMEDKPVALRRLLQHTRSERALIAMFLALLELVRLQAILLRQDRAFSEIFIKKHTGFDALMNEGLSSARDDWR